ncbi:hypothetical protein [Catellatospora sp. NPDC049609]|uniref:hypothetical protein n=1 Tax=Catellatospora sp. NPDC049609 TaxID=3155505 RepID=UPI00343C635A
MGNHLEGGMPTASIARDFAFKDLLPTSHVRDFIRQSYGKDIGFDLGDEGFSAMLALTHLPLSGHPNEQQLIQNLARSVEDCRWRSRFRFFPRVHAFAADTDCTALAINGLWKRGYLPAQDLHRTVAELTRSAVQMAGAQSPDLDEGGIQSGVMMVYWEDGAEPGALPRGRKHDAVACANALYTVGLVGAQLNSFDDYVVTRTLNYVRNHLASGRYLVGTRYYPSPEAFLHAASRLCGQSTRYARALEEPLRRALTHKYSIDVAASGDSLRLALLMIARSNLKIEDGQRELAETLAGWQRPDGSWPACSYYRMGRFPVYFGSPHITTVFALRAISSLRAWAASADGSAPRQPAGIDPV